MDGNLFPTTSTWKFWVPKTIKHKDQIQRFILQGHIHVPTLILNKFRERYNAVTMDNGIITQ